MSGRDLRLKGSRSRQQKGESIRTKSGNGAQEILLDKGKNTSDYGEIPHGGMGWDI